MTNRDWLTTAGLGVVATATVIASFSALAGLAVHAGWDWRMSILLPATVDVYGVTATRIWLSPSSNSEARSHAKIHALAALFMSMAGKAVNHALDAKALVLGSRLWLLVVAVSLVPPAALGALMHLMAMRGRATVESDSATTGTIAQVTSVEASQGTPQGALQVTASTGGQGTSQGASQVTAEAPSQVTRADVVKSPAKASAKPPSRSRRTDEELINDLEVIIAEHYRDNPGMEIKVQPVARQLGIGRDRARELLDHMNVRPIRKTG